MKESLGTSQLISGAWWVENPFFLAGGYPGHREPAKAIRRLDLLLEIGIRRFLSLQEKDETDGMGRPFEDYLPRAKALAESRNVEISFERVPVRDLSVPSVPAMGRILDLIDRHVTENKPLYVHCWGGHGRTGTVVGCWLVRRYGIAGEDALQRITELRSRYELLAQEPAPQTLAQIEMVQTWNQLDPGGSQQS